MLVPGSSFAHFRIESVLGHGGMGVVYKATDTRHDRVVALKVIDDQFSQSESYRSKLAEEATLTTRVDSPYVVKILEHDEIDSHPFLAMEFIPGQDLRGVGSELGFDRQLTLCRQIAEGVGAAHSAGLVHRDLKPENIRLAEDGTVRILDFGLAKTISADTVDESGHIEGSLYYLSPEQLSGLPVGQASDLFSLGTLTYELFTGVRPFEGDYPAAIMYSILHEEPVPPCEKNPSLPNWVDPLVAKLLAKIPQDRFASTAALLEYIDHSERGAPTAVSRQYVKPRLTVTVVDLKNMSGDPSWDYFCMGFTEDIIRELSRRSDLIVAAEPATSQQRDIRETFKRCRSDFVVAGSLLKWQEKIKLGLNIHGDGGDTLVFGETYEGNAADLFDLLSQASRDSSITLANVTGSQAREVFEVPETDVSAYDYYLKGKAYYETNTAEDFEFAIRMFQRAIEIDPKMALAYAGLSDVYTFQYMAYYDHTEERIRLAREAAERAMTINRALPEVHRSLGRYYMFTGKPAEAEKCFLTAIKYNPKYAIGYRTIGWLKRSFGQYREALTWARKSLELAPTDLETLLLLSLIHMDERRFTVAISTLQRAIELGPDYGRAYYNLGSVYMKLGVFELALENLIQAARFRGDPNCYLDAGYVYMATGRLPEACRALEESIKAGFFTFASHYYLGFVLNLMGKSDESIRHYRKVVELTQTPDGSISNDLNHQGFRALALIGLGRKEEAGGLLEKLEHDAANAGEILANVARAWALLGDAAKSRTVLDHAVVAFWGPTEKELAPDPHFASLIR